jgi:hypothetical protein
MLLHLGGASEGLDRMVAGRTFGVYRGRLMVLGSFLICRVYLWRYWYAVVYSAHVGKSGK